MTPSDSAIQEADARTRSLAAEMRPADDQVLIRMYGQGLGDCFLMALPRSGGERSRPVYVLIDCGVIMGTPGGAERMRRIVADIRRTTRDEALLDEEGEPKGHLDLLVVTHRHWDHLSGFVYAEEEWQKIQVDELWTSWTEAPDPNGLSGVLERLLTTQRRALAAVADKAIKLGLDVQLETVINLMGFLGGEPEEQGFAAAKSVGDAFDLARARAGGNHTLCEPGEVRPLPGTDAVAYVLGPPKDLDLLRRMNPSRKEAERETFGLDPTIVLRRMLDEPSALNAFVMPLLGPALAVAEDGDEEVALVRGDLFERSFPFDRSVRVPLAVAETAATNEVQEFPALASYYDETNHWRRIDTDWLAAAEAFALTVDNLINNTSLVLAIELPPKNPEAAGKVLLFVADAQVGNWLSWDEIERWKPMDGAHPSQTTPRLDDLLRRTAFYKVGHHGSHNATLKARGVERMRDDGSLAAFVPVSAAVAQQIKGWTEMPLAEMLDALDERCGGAVVLANGELWKTDGGARAERVRDRLELATSEEELPAMVRSLRDGGEVEIEGAVPLWVQAAVGY